MEQRPDGVDRGVDRRRAAGRQANPQSVRSRGPRCTFIRMEARRASCGGVTSAKISTVRATSRSGQSRNPPARRLPPWPTARWNSTAPSRTIKSGSQMAGRLCKSSSGLSKALLPRRFEARSPPPSDSVWPALPRYRAYSGFALDALTTLPQRSISSPSKQAEILRGFRRLGLRPFRQSGAEFVFVDRFDDDRIQRVTITSGIPVGAKNGCQFSSQNPATPPSIMVGKSGSSGERLSLVIASARFRPGVIKGWDEGILLNEKSTSPLASAVIEGALPL